MVPVDPDEKKDEEETGRELARNNRLWIMNFVDGGAGNADFD